MDFTKIIISFSLTFVATFLLLSTAVSATARAPPPVSAISPFCENVDNRTLCAEEMVKGAETWREAMRNAIIAAIERVEDGKPIIDDLASKLQNKMESEYIPVAVRNCDDGYHYLIWALIESLPLVKDDPRNLLKSRLSYSLSCRIPLHLFNVSVPEVDALEQEISKRTGVLLAILQKKP